MEKIKITSLEVNTTKYTDDLDKANIVNNYLLLFLLKKILSTCPFWKITYVYPIIDSPHLTVDSVSHLLHYLEVHKACGLDGISPHLLKETASNIAPMLTLIPYSR